jgi:hypothetical protein
VKSRQAPICDIEIGHRSSSDRDPRQHGHALGQTVVWDGTNGNDAGTGARTSLSRAPKLFSGRLTRDLAGRP